MQARPPETLSSLQAQTDRWFERASASLLGQLPCRAGCSHCCIGPFPITMLDITGLQEGLHQLPILEREAIVRRASGQAAAMEAAYPLLARSPFLDQWADSEIDRLVEQFQAALCPALGEGGLCRLYEHRPLACRSMGIPEEDASLVNGACAVQTFVPIVRLPASLRAEEERLAHREAVRLEEVREAAGAEGEEVLLPYGFLPVLHPDRGEQALR